MGWRILWYTRSGALLTAGCNVCAVAASLTANWHSMSVALCHKHGKRCPLCMPAPLPTCSNEEAKEAAAASLRAATQGSGSGSISGSSDGGDEDREPPVEGVLSRPPLVSGRSIADG